MTQPDAFDVLDRTASSAARARLQPSLHSFPCGDIKTGYINRQEIEAQGYVYTRHYSHRDHCLYLEPPDVDAGRRAPSLAELN
jgi:hypothetical protein